MSYTFEHSNMRFPEGSFAESVVLDRYVVSSTDQKDLRVGDTVVFVDETRGTRKVGVITTHNYVAGDNWRIVSPHQVDVEDRDGERHLVPVEHIVKPLETTPAEMWSRWAYGAALVEAKQHEAAVPVPSETFDRWEDEFRWLLDGYRYSPGGRIQLGLGHEYLGLTKAPLTLLNCFVGPAVERGDDPLDQWTRVLANLRNQIEIQRRGGGYGINVTNIATVKGGYSGRIALHLPDDHRDYAEIDDLRQANKFDGVDVVTNLDGFRTTVKTDVIVVHDSIDGIMDAMNEMIRRAYEGYDIAVSFSRLRPRYSSVSNIGRSSGAASWMTLFALAARLLRRETIDAVDFAELFAFTTNLVEQGGSRRGALMLVYNVDGPVIENFITRKREPGRLVGANVSVGVTDTFMERVKRFQRWVESGENSNSWDRYGVDDGDYGAHGIWRLIVESAHAAAEPGVIFLDRYNKESNSWYYAQIEATNP